MPDPSAADTIGCNASASAVSTATALRAGRRVAGMSAVGGWVKGESGRDGGRGLRLRCVASTEVQAKERSWRVRHARRREPRQREAGRQRPRDSAGPPATDSHFTHFDPAGQAHMVDVGAKPVTTACRASRRPDRDAPRDARAHPRGNREEGRRARRGPQSPRSRPPSGPRSSFPLCHPIALTSVTVAFDLDAAPNAVAIEVTARNAGPDRRRDGGALRCFRGPPDDLRHVQGGRPRDEDRGAAAAREVRRALGPLQGQAR